MNQKDAEFLRKLQAAFNVEAEEHLQAISSGLIELEREAAPERRQEIVASIFREAHSLKGAARAVNAGEIETICQSLESVFSASKRHEVRPTPDLLDPLHAAVSAVGRALPGGDMTQPGLSAEQTAELIGRLATLESAGDAAGESAGASPGNGGRTAPPAAPSLPVRRAILPRCSAVRAGSAATAPGSTWASVSTPSAAARRFPPGVTPLDDPFVPRRTHPARPPGLGSADRNETWSRRLNECRRCHPAPGPHDG